MFYFKLTELTLNYTIDYIKETSMIMSTKGSKNALKAQLPRLAFYNGSAKETIVLFR